MRRRHLLEEHRLAKLRRISEVSEEDEMQLTSRSDIQAETPPEKLSHLCGIVAVSCLFHEHLEFLEIVECQTLIATSARVYARPVASR